MACLLLCHLGMNGIIMKSINFEFLRDKWPELASLGGFAEQYVWPDPASAMVKLRSYIESMIHRLPLRLINTIA